MWQTVESQRLCSVRAAVGRHVRTWEMRSLVRLAKMLHQQQHREPGEAEPQLLRPRLAQVREQVVQRLEHALMPRDVKAHQQLDLRSRGRSTLNPVRSQRVPEGWLSRMEL